MQPPRFWYDGAEGRDAAPALQAVLRPVSWVYGAVAGAKIANGKPETVLPAVCVGNVTLGGAGKTPIVRAVRARLAARGIETHTLSRGYGGKLKGPLRVDGARHKAGDVGDEPLLHARDGAAWIGADRVESAKVAKADGARALVLDDGFQNTGLAYALSLLVFDGEAGVGNGRVFPAGPLREPLAPALSRADAVIVMQPSPDARNAQPALVKALAASGKPVIRAWLSPAAPPPPKPLYAFAGIGRPDKFFATLEAQGAKIVGRLAFPDHHPYSERDMTNLAIDAAAVHARLVTTEKDFMRIGARWRPQVSVLPVTAQFSDDAALDALLARIA